MIEPQLLIDFSIKNIFLRFINFIPHSVVPIGLTLFLMDKISQKTLRLKFERNTCT
jgi:hypothetical protein